MNFKEKLAAALTLLASKGIWRSNYAPPIFRLLWLLGFKVPPPHLASFRANFISMGVVFGFLMGILRWFNPWSNQKMSITETVITAACFGLLFGLWMAVYYRKKSRKYGLPKWKDFNPPTLRPVSKVSII